MEGLTTEDRSAHVVNDVWLRAARTVVQRAVTRKRLPSNPFSGATVALPRRAPKLREREFHDEEWRTVLRATLQPSPPRMEPYNAAARRWVPWLCAYTGSRPGEACQLRAEDVALHPAGFWVINITPEAGTVKGGSARIVPLHEHLIEQGFISFAQSKGIGPLFFDPDGRRKVDDDPTNPVRQPWVKSRDKLSEWVRGLGVTDPGISPNHAWRHTYKRRAARSGIERRVRFAMCGHTPTDEGDRYETPSVWRGGSSRGMRSDGPPHHPVEPPRRHLQRPRGLCWFQATQVKDPPTVLLRSSDYATRTLPFTPNAAVDARPLVKWAQESGRLNKVAATWSAVAALFAFLSWGLGLLAHS
jgi:integrase